MPLGWLLEVPTLEFMGLSLGSSSYQTYYIPMVFSAVGITLVETVSAYSGLHAVYHTHCHSAGLGACPRGLSTETTALATRVAVFPRPCHSWSPRWPAALKCGNP